MNKPNLRYTVAALIGTVALLTAGAACSSGSGDTDATTTAPTSDVPTVTDVWARPALAGGNTAVYLTIHGGKTADALVGVSGPADFAESVEIHESVVVDDDAAHGDGHDSHDDTATTSHSQMRTMRPVDAVPVPASGDVALAPGGLHVMVMGLQDALAVGDEVPVVLHFAEAGEIRATATVRER